MKLPLNKLVLLVCLLPLAAKAVVFTSDTTILPENSTYDGADIIVSNATLTVDGPHTFASLLVGSNGIVTHTFSSSGTIITNILIADEPQILVGTNEVALANLNITAAMVSVKDNSGTITYQTNTDFIVRTSGSDTFLNRSETSTIPDGAMVLVSYGIPGGTISSGLFLTVTGNVEVASGGFINANGRGFGGNTGTGNGGEAGSLQSGAGAGHGGYGGLSSSNAPGGGSYGAFDQPATLGSGGGFGVSAAGSPGGGLVRLIVSGETRIDGSITANALNATNSRSGGGSGGSVWITTQTVRGNGAITAHGGNGEPIHGGGGGGGRIAIYCDTNNLTGNFGAYGGLGWRNGGAGTILRMITFTNGWFLVDNNGRIGTNTPVNVGNNSDVTIRSNAIVTSVSPWNVRHMTIASNSTLATLGPTTTMTINAQTLTIDPTASVLADGAGFSASLGTSPGGFHAGGGHGGAGGNTFTNITGDGRGGLPFGTQTPPVTFGSGGGGVYPSVGGAGNGGAGGGYIRLNITSQLNIGGRVSANGRDGTSAGGGAGGSIWITAPTITGAGPISANGGSGSVNSGGGGGGRIAVYVTTTNLFTGPITAYGGGGGNRGGAGTIYLDVLGPAGPLVPDFILDNGGFPAPNARTNTTVNSFFSSTPNLIVRNGAEGFISSTMALLMNVNVRSNSTLSLNGNLTVISNVLIEAGGSIQSDGSGFNSSANGVGFPVSSTYYAGGGGNAGYGGNGGTNNARGGNVGSTVTGTTTSPSTAGGAGGGSGSSFAPFGGTGGGVFSLTVNRSLTNNGRISSDGKIGTGNYAGGGAGGSVRLTLANYYGNGTVSANGGPGILPGGGGGGGGRIGITLNSNFFTGTLTTYGGSGANYGGAGTIYLKTNSAPIGVLTVDNGGFVATNTVYEIGYNGHLIASGGGAPLLPSSSSTLASLLIKSNGFLTAPASPIQQTLTLAGNMTIDEGGLFTADGRGNGSNTGTGSGNSTSTPRGGASHGGFGALNFNNSNFGIVYGSITSPSSAGSGGASGSGTSVSPLGGAGGGALRLQFNNQNAILTVNGRLSANGRDGELNSGGGSGGSLLITGVTLAGNGIISANGGAGNGTAGGSGGGRIAISYTSNLFTGQLTASGGGGAVAGGAGTIYTKFNNAPTGTLLIDNGSLTGTNTPLSSLFSLPPSPFNLTISGGASVFALTPMPQLSNLVITAGSTFTMRPNETNIALDVLNNVTIAAGGAINVDGKGFGRSLGTAPGASIASKGAGGNSQSGALGGTNYGSAIQPVLRGSGGGVGANVYISGCEGGGAIRLTVGKTLSLDGALSASGIPGIQDDSGGGSGGSIWISANRFTGTGNIRANGGDGDLFGGGGGGGGRIAIYSPTNTFSGLTSVVGGIGHQDGLPGSILTSTNLYPSESISGRVTNTLGQGISGMSVLCATSFPVGNIVAITDTNGNYSLIAPLTSNGSLTPVIGTNVCVPSVRTFTNLGVALPNQNFLLVQTLIPTLATAQSGTNLLLTWEGISGVTYSLESSTNLTQWTLEAGFPNDTNSTMQTAVFNAGAPAKFFRLRATY